MKLIKIFNKIQKHLRLKEVSIKNKLNYKIFGNFTILEISVFSEYLVLGTNLFLCREKIFLLHVWNSSVMIVYNDGRKIEEK